MKSREETALSRRLSLPETHQAAVDLIVEAHREARSMTDAATALGVSRATLYRLLGRFPDLARELRT